MSTSERPASRPGGEGGERPRTSRNSHAAPRRRRRSTGLTVAATVGKVLGTLLLIIIVTGCFLACYGVVYLNTVIIPNASPNLNLNLNESSTIYYEDQETGEVVELATCYGAENREILDFNEIPDVFIQAAIAIEDKRFYQHKGVDWFRTAGAVFYMFTGQDIQGGSTITQQVIKNYSGNDEVTVKRKITEIFKALELEKEYSKEDIITMYLNYIYLGSNQYGIATASEYYFGKDVSEITLAEAASIIGITNNPSIYGPNSTVVMENRDGEMWDAKQWNKYRQELILNAMLEQGMISQEEHDAAVAQELVFTMGQSGGDAEQGTSNINSWYVDEVIAEVVDYYMETYDLNSKAANQMVYGGGLKIYTPFDPDVQAAVDEIYSNRENLDYTSSDGQQMQSAITIVDNESGYVVAMAGKIGEKTGNRVWNNATDSVRQPGSSIKPLAAYSPAIDMGLVTPYTIIDDSPYQILDGTAWPRNDNREYHGLTTVLNGITHSTNTIAVKLVGNYVTPEASLQFMQERYGITTLVDNVEINGQVKTDKAVAPMALGGLTNGLSPYEMTAAYATFPRNGAYTNPTVVLRVETKDGELVWDNEPETTYPIKDSTAYYMNVLLQAAAGGTGNAAKSQMSGMTMAGKTGTTTDNYDRWFAGYTPYYTAVVWTGYENPTYMRVSGGNPAAKLWGQVMAIVHKDLENKSFTSNVSLVTRQICLDCGQLATDACSNDIRGNRTMTGTFVEGTQPTAYCSCHVPITICTADPVLNWEGNVVANAYHYATEFCPEDTVKEVYIVDYTRDEAASSVQVDDIYYMKYFYDGLAEPYCSVHTTPAVVPSDPDFMDPTLPPDWGFPGDNDPDDPNNWGDNPSSEPSTEPSAQPTVQPSQNPSETPPTDEEFVPAIQ